MSLPTKLDVQLLGNGTVILMSVSVSNEMNTNFVISDEEFVRMVRELLGKAQSYPESELNRIREKMEAALVTGDKRSGD